MRDRVKSPNNKKEGQSLQSQRDEKATNEKWGGDIFSYDINQAMNEFNTLKDKSSKGTLSQEEQALIQTRYGGDLSSWDSKRLYDEYNADLNFVNFIDAANAAKNEAVAQAKKDEAQKLQYADTRRSLMEKYIPETLLAQGVANTGYTADALLKAENNYNQYALGAMSDRAQAEQSAMQQYQDAASAYKQKMDEDAYTRFLEREKEKESAKAIQDAYVQTIDAYVKEGYIETKDAAIEALRAYGADEETVQRYSDYWDKTHEQGNTTNQEGGSNTTPTTPNTTPTTPNNKPNSSTPPQTQEANRNPTQAVKPNTAKAMGAGDELNTFGHWHRDFSNQVGDVFSVKYVGADGIAKAGKLKTDHFYGKETDVGQEAQSKGYEEGEVFVYRGALYVAGKNGVYSIADTRDASAVYEAILPAFGEQESISFVAQPSQPYSVTAMAKDDPLNNGDYYWRDLVSSGGDVFSVKYINGAGEELPAKLKTDSYSGHLNEGYSTSDTAVSKYARELGITKGTVFLYDGKLYVVVPGNYIYSIQKTRDYYDMLEILRNGYNSQQSGK